MPASRQLSCSLCIREPERRFIRYLLHRPADAGQAPSKGWPLLLFLHGAGERGSRIGSILRHGPPRMAGDDPKFPFVLVSPQCPLNETWEQQPLMSLLDHLLATEAIDSTRVYATGISMGGYGVWDLAARHPDRFAAVVPICGGGNLLPILLFNPKEERAARRLAIRAYHGAKDDVVPLVESERMVAAWRAAGAACDLVVDGEAGHDCWTRAYAERELFDWLLSHQSGGSRRAKRS